MSLYNGKREKPDISAELQEEIANQPLSITGTIPSWLSGTLVRNGPINVTIDGKSNAHWFDGLAMLHAFSFQEGKVNYSNKFLRTDAYTSVFEEGSLNYSGFAVDPCRSLFKRFLSMLIPTSQLSLHNANVNVAKMADNYVAMTEIPLPVKFDIKTLDTLGVLEYQDELPKDKCWESAHPHQDQRRKETLNYLIKYGRTSYYTLYRIQEGSLKREIIAEVPVEQPAYMHSFAVTENYAIFTEFPFVVKPLDLITKGKAFIKNFTWQPERGTQFIVVDRHSGELVGKYLTRPFFAFHHVGAFEENGTLHIDLVTYEDAGVLTKIKDLAIEEGYPTQFERFSLSLETGEITSDVLFSSTVEFPRINDALDGHPYTYAYMAGFSDKAKDKGAESLYKLNTSTKEWLKWSENGCSPGEPVFAGSPNGTGEDEGVILALVLDHIHKDSFLLVLDAKSFTEIGRARVPHAIPPGIHGQHFQ